MTAGDNGDRRATGRDLDIVVIAKGSAELAIKQHRTPCVAVPAGDRGENVVVAGHQRVAGKKSATAVADEPLELNLGSQHPAGCELAVNANLRAAEKPAAAPPDQAVVVIERAPDMAADMEARPVVDRLWGANGWCFRVGLPCQLGAERISF